MVLIDRIRNGDRDAIGQLVSKYSQCAYRYALQLQSERRPTQAFDAGDVVAETLMRVHRSAARFDGRCAFRTWLHRIVRNSFFDLNKRASRGSTAFSLDSIWLDEESDTTAEVRDAGPSPLALVLREADRDGLWQAVDRMPQHHRTLLVQFYRESMTYQEIADQTGLPVCTVKSRVHRARIALRATCTSRFASESVSA